MSSAAEYIDRVKAERNAMRIENDRLRILLKAIAEYPITDARDMDAINIQKIAIDALQSTDR